MQFFAHLFSLLQVLSTIVSEMYSLHLLLILAIFDLGFHVKSAVETDSNTQTLSRKKRLLLFPVNGQVVVSFEFQIDKTFKNNCRKQIFKLNLFLYFTRSQSPAPNR